MIESQMQKGQNIAIDKGAERVTVFPNQVQQRQRETAGVER
jgi:hypothetical protein